MSRRIKKRYRLVIGCIFVLLSLTGCNKDDAYKRGMEEANNKWKASEAPALETKEDDLASIVENKKKSNVTETTTAAEETLENGETVAYARIQYKINTITFDFHRPTCEKLETLDHGWEDTALDRKSLLKAGYIACPICKP